MSSIIKRLNDRLESHGENTGIFLAVFMGLIMGISLISCAITVENQINARAFERSFSVKKPSNEVERDIIQPKVFRIIQAKKNALDKFDQQLATFKMKMDSLPRDTDAQNDVYAKMRYKYQDLLKEREKLGNDYHEICLPAKEAGYSLDHF